jgi:flagellar protein FliS
MTQRDVERSYRETEIRGASNVDCVIMMYDMLLADLRKAIGCFQSGDIEARTAALKHALGVLGDLQASLQMESGGEAARVLYRFYSLARAKIMEGHIKCRAKIFEEIVRSAAELRSIWVRVRDQSAPLGEYAATQFLPWTEAPEQPATSGIWSA